MKDVRKRRLQALIDTRFNGDRSRFMAATGLTKGRVTQLLDANEPFGDVAAERLREKLALPAGYFDSAAAEPVRAPELAAGLKPPRAAQVAAELMGALDVIATHLCAMDDFGRTAAAQILARLASNPEDKPQAVRALLAVLPEHQGPVGRPPRAEFSAEAEEVAEAIDRLPTPEERRKANILALSAIGNSPAAPGKTESPAAGAKANAAVAGKPTRQPARSR